MKLIKPFYGVPDGEIYPQQYRPGDILPPELQAAALACGAAEESGQGGLELEPPKTPETPETPETPAETAKPKTTKAKA